MDRCILDWKGISMKSSQRIVGLLVDVVITLATELVLILSESLNFLNIITVDTSLKNGEFNE